MAELDASVLIPVLNEAAHLPAVAPAMLSQRDAGRVEFLFIDGGSSDGTTDMVQALAREDERVRLLHNPAGHTPAALNVGLRAARGRYVVRMDAHTAYPERYIAAGVERLRQGDVAHVSGPQRAVGFDAGSRRVALALRSRLGVGGASFRLAETELEVDSGFLGVWERRRLLDVGGWDERWIMNQDAELAARIRASGGRVVCIPEMSADYRPRNRLRALGRQYFRYGRYRARTALRHPSSVRASHLVPPALVLTVLAAAGLRGPLARVARAGVGIYAAAVAAESARLAGGDAAATAGDGLRLPAVFATMHLSWGAGMLVGTAQALPRAQRAPLSSATISAPARSIA